MEFSLSFLGGFAVAATYSDRLLSESHKRWLFLVSAAGRRDGIKAAWLCILKQPRVHLSGSVLLSGFV